MTSQTAATVAVGLIGLVGVLMSALANIQVRRTGDRAAKDLEAFRLSLQEEKDVRSEARSRQSQAEATVERYREPLVGSAFDLQARIYNISTGRFFGPDQSTYHLNHTLYVFAQYLGWREIIRQDIQFLDLGEIPATKALAELLEGVTSALSRTSPALSSNFKLFRGEQRAIGEKMVVSANSQSQGASAHGCLGYAGFVEALSRPDFEPWFEKLKGYIERLMSTRQPDLRRLSLLQNALIDLIDSLDPDYVRFPRHLRKSMDVPADLAGR